MGFRLAVAFAAIVLSACTNAYQDFYVPARPNPDVILSQEEPVVLPSWGSVAVDFNKMFEDGYGLVGSAEFVGGIQNQDGAMAQAKKVGASRVVIRAKYRDTKTGVTSVTTPTTTTAYTSGTIYGSGYGTDRHYSGTTTIYGSQTSYIPYSVDRYDQYALYFAPLRRAGWGILLDEPTNDAKRLAGTNKGMQVRAVRRGSPAYREDILPGDVIVSIGGRELGLHRDPRAVRPPLPPGSHLEAVIYRGSMRLTKRLPRSPDEPW